MSFKNYLEEEVNSHMTHLSDLVFISGTKGTREAVNYLRDLRHMFSKSNKNAYTVKFDGSPAIFVGIDPTDHKFFVAKKGIFNKNPLVYKTQADIDKDLSGELHTKFSLMFQYLSKLGITSGIYQGDLMFSHDDLKTETIDGQKMITFHPNTIVYAVPVGSELALKINKAKIGVVFHTTYTGNSFETLKASFGKPIVNKFKHSSDVWAIDATVENSTSNFSLSDEEYIQVELLLKDIGIQFNDVPTTLLNTISENDELRSIVLIYINSLVKKNIKSITGLEMSNGFFDFIHARYQKEIDKRKTEKSKTDLNDKRSNILQFFDAFGHNQIAKIFDLARSIDLLKDLLLSKMRKIEGLSHFIKMKDGFKVTNPEGFVAIQSESGKAIKLVDRFGFSRNNFSPDVIKGWTK